MPKKSGSSIRLAHHPCVYSFAAVVGSKEADGPMGKYFTHTESDPMLGQKTWEQAETRLQQMALQDALQNGCLQQEELDCIIAGDLVNQCTSSTFAARHSAVPFLGVYGACSTMAQALLIAGMLTDAGFTRFAAAVTSSHFSTAERQFRFPLSYGGQRTPTSQWTCTASGAVVVSAEGNLPRLVGGCIGRIVDLGVTDATNMGAAMAPAAADTIFRYLRDTHTKPADYDAIVTGDLGNIGSPLLYELLEKQGICIREVHHDCGAMMFSEQTQDTHAGGSGCGCSASILAGYFLPQLRDGRLHRILFAATGALLSAMSSQQGESIPGICHLVELTA